MRLRRLAILVLAATLPLVVGCASTSQLAATRNFKFPPDKKLAVLPFHNLSTLPRAGDIVSDLFSTQLLSAMGSSVLEPSAQQKILADTLLAIDETSFPADLKGIGRALNVDYLLVGSVTEFRYRHNVNEQPVVGITARIVEVASGATVWTASYSEVGPSLFPGRDALGMLAQRAVVEMAETFR